jgi:4-amino-4-deoxychorismate lyase
MFVYLNGQLIRKEEALISAYDHGYLYGVGLFETFRVYDGHIFLLDDHLQRLNEGLSSLLIEKSFEREEVEEAISLLLQANDFRHAYIRLNVSAGWGELGLTVDPYLEPMVIIYSKPLPPPGIEMSEKEAQLLKINRNTPEGNYRLKSHHFLNNILAKREIGSRMDVEGIFLTAEGYLAEGVVSNLFWVKGNTVFTPSIKTGILNGITRQFVIQLVKQKGCKVEEGFFKPEALNDADELFITNSIQEVVGINQWNNQTFPGKKGNMALYLQEQYRHYCSKLSSRNELR